MKGKELFGMQGDPSLEVAASVAETVESLLEGQEWSGGSPYEIQMVDAHEQKAFVYKLRRGEDWISIQESSSDSSGLVRNFYLERKDGAWTYQDAYLIKEGESSLPKLQAAHERLRSALESSISHPKALDEGPGELLPDTAQESESDS